MLKASSYTIKIILAASLGSISYGYSSGIAGSISGQPSFIDYFQYNSDDGKIADIFNGLFSCGGFIGSLFAGYSAEKFGRKKAIFISCCILIIGSIIMTASILKAMLYVSRIIAGFAIGMIVMLIPLWQTEISPAESRGILVGSHGVMILLGYFICNWIGVGFYFCKEAGFTWRVPVAIQMVWPAILSILMIYMPESPRWLIENSKLTEAKKVMNYLDPDFDDNSFSTLVEQISSESNKSSWISLFSFPAYRKRLIMGLVIMVGGQATGTLAIANYAPTLYANLGFGSRDQLLLGAAYITSGLIWNFVSAFLIDRVGRKILVTIGFFGSGVMVMTCELILVALYSDTDNKAGNSASVFFIFLHVFFYGGAADATTYVYATEIWPTHIRAKGTAVAVCGLFAGILAFTTGVSTALNNIHWKYYLIFISCSVASSAVVFLFFPETKGLSLEEINNIFDKNIENASDKDRYDEYSSSIQKMKNEKDIIVVTTRGENNTD